MMMTFLLFGIQSKHPYSSKEKSHTSFETVSTTCCSDSRGILDGVER